METTSERVADLLTRVGVEFDYVGGSFTGTPPKWADRMNYWSITLKRGEVMTFDYWTGQAIERPELTDVIHSLIADMNTLEVEDTFEGWCDQFGYNTDSISDRDTFDKVKAQTYQLRGMFNALELAGLTELLLDY